MISKVILAFLLAFAFFLKANAQQVTKEQLDMIADFADRLCQEMELAGEEFSLSGQAEADLGSILKRLADIGVEGAADFSLKRYSGFTQEDLLEAMRESNQCKTIVWRDLQNQIFQDEKQSGLAVCDPPGGASGDEGQRARLFTNRGVDHERRGEYSAAIACFETALTFTPSSVTILMNLAKTHRRWGNGDRDTAYTYLDRAIKVMRHAMQTIDRAAIERIKRFQRRRPSMTCAERNDFTGEIFRTDVWYMRAQMYIEDNQTEKAIADFSDVINTYPVESCYRDNAVANALVERAVLHCRNGSRDAAALDYNQAVELGFFDAKTATNTQRSLAKASYYNGRLDGQFGSASMAALQGWVSDGCPILP